MHCLSENRTFNENNCYLIRKKDIGGSNIVRLCLTQILLPLERKQIMNNQSQTLSTPHVKNVGVAYSHSFIEIQIKTKIMHRILAGFFKFKASKIVYYFFYTDVKLPAHFLTKKKKVFIYIFCYSFPTEKYFKVISNIKKCLSTSVFVMCSCQPLPQLLQ